MRRGTVVAAAVLVCCVLAVPAIAASILPEPPYETNSECMACHDVAAPGATSTLVDFRVPGEVDYERCKTCHLYLPDRRVFPGGHTYLMHYHTDFDVCVECHEDTDEPFFTMPEGAPRVSRLLSTPYGYFASPDSLDASPEVLHEVHMTPSWVETTFGDQYSVGCSRCHAAASCGACHGDEVPHEEHALPDYPAVSYKQADGASATVAPSSCVNEYCHAIAAAGTDAFNEPSCAECHAHTAEDLAAAHAPPAEADYCTACHTGEIDTLHADVDVVIGDTVYESCYACHRVDLGPATSDCGVCHGTFGDHTYGTGVHIASGEGCLNCHSADLVAEHANLEPSSCEACHTHEWFPVDGWDNTCRSCHDQVSHQHGGGSGGGGHGGGGGGRGGRR